MKLFPKKKFDPAVHKFVEALYKVLNSGFTMLKMRIIFTGISLLLGSGVASADYSPCFYVECYAGYAFNDWKTSLDDVFQPLTPEAAGTTIINHNRVNHPNGFAGGGDIGYQFNPCFAIEFGGFGYPKVNYNYFTQSTIGTDVQSSRNKGSITNWFLYSAARLNWSISDFDLFAKFGVAFRYGRIQNKNVSFDSATTPEMTSLSQGSNMSFPSAIAGGGLQYLICDRLSINGQYLYLPASVGFISDITSFNQFRIRQTHIITGGMSFTFP